MATVPVPTRPWAASADNPAVVTFDVHRLPGVSRPAAAIGPQVATDAAGAHWIFYGSGDGAVIVQRLNAAGTTTVGPSLNRMGRRLTEAYAAGTPVQPLNGDEWVQTGYTSLITELSGQEYLLSNGVNRYDPCLSGTTQTKRQLLLDRLDWANGWPVTNAGSSAETAPQSVPVSTGSVADNFKSGSLSVWVPGNGWQAARGAAGVYVTVDAGAIPAEGLSEKVVHGDRRVEGGVRFGTVSEAGVTLDANGAGRARQVVISVDRTSQSLVDHMATPAAGALAAGFDCGSWHQVTLGVSGRLLTASVSDAGLYDPQAVLIAQLASGLGSGRVGLVGQGWTLDGAAFSAATLFRLVNTAVVAPARGPLERADSVTSFPRRSLRKGWSWVRRDDAVSVSGDELHFRLQQATLIHSDNRTTPPSPPGTASALLRDPPASFPWTVQSEVSLPWGDTAPATTAEADLIIVYNTDNYDNSWVSLTATAQLDVRRVRFALQLDGTATDQALCGWAGIAPSGPTTYLRVQHSVTAASEQLLWAATSVGGRHWEWYGTLVLPDGPATNVRRFAHNAPATPTSTATVDYLDFYGPDHNPPPPPGPDRVRQDPRR